MMQAKTNTFCDCSSLHLKQAELMDNIPVRPMILSANAPIQRRIPKSINIEKKREVKKARIAILNTIDEINSESPTASYKSMVLLIAPDDLDIPEYEMDEEDFRILFSNYLQQCKNSQIGIILERMQKYYPQKVFDISLYHQPLNEFEIEELRRRAAGVFESSDVMGEIRKYDSEANSHGVRLKAVLDILEKLERAGVKAGPDGLGKVFSGVTTFKNVIKCVESCDEESLIFVHRKLLEEFSDKTYSSSEASPSLEKPSGVTRKKDSDPIWLLQQTFRNIVGRDTALDSKEEKDATNIQYEMMARAYLLQLEEFIKNESFGSIFFHDLSGTLDFIGKGGYCLPGEIMLSDRDLSSKSVIQTFIHEIIHIMSKRRINDNGSYRRRSYFYNKDALTKLHNADHYISVLFPERVDEVMRQKMRYGIYINPKSVTPSIEQNVKIVLWNYYFAKIAGWADNAANRYQKLLKCSFGSKIYEDNEDYSEIVSILKVFGISRSKRCQHHEPHKGKKYLLLEGVDYALAEHVAWQYKEIQRKVAAAKVTVMHSFLVDETAVPLTTKASLAAKTPTELIALAGLSKEDSLWLPKNLDKQVAKLESR